jgi:DNA primase
VTKSKRKGKMLIDYLNNGRGSTAVVPYSTRARPGAAISMPLEWAEPRLAVAGSFHRRQRSFIHAPMTNAVPQFQQSREAAERHLAL